MSGDLDSILQQEVIGYLSISTLLFMDLGEVTNLCGSSIIFRNQWSCHHDWDNLPGWLMVHIWPTSTGHHWLSCPHSTDDQCNLSSGVPALPLPAYPSIDTKLPCNSLTPVDWCTCYPKPDILLLVHPPSTMVIPTLMSSSFSFLDHATLAVLLQGSDKCFLVLTFYSLISL